MTATNKKHQCDFRAVGDIMLHGYTAEKISRSGDHFFPWARIKGYLKGSDILFGNLETMISHERKPTAGAPGKYYSLPGTGSALQELGFSVVNIAHNHSYDWGAEGVEATIAELKKAGIPHGGLGKTASEARRSVRLNCAHCGKPYSFLFYCNTYNTLDPHHSWVAAAPSSKVLQLDIEAERRESSVVVVSIHGGACMNYWPSPDMLKACRDAAEYGASIVLAHHPHVPQGIEMRERTLIAYGLPDFVRPVPYDEDEVYEGMRCEQYASFVLRMKIGAGFVDEWSILPCILDESLQTRPADHVEAEAIRTRVYRLSNDIVSGRSSALHLNHAGKYFGDAYGKNLLRTLKRGGIPWLLRRVLTLKPHHFAILARGIWTKLRIKGKRL